MNPGTFVRVVAHDWVGQEISRPTLVQYPIAQIISGPDEDGLFEVIGGGRVWCAREQDLELITDGKDK